MGEELPPQGVDRTLGGEPDVHGGQRKRLRILAQQPLRQRGEKGLRCGDGVGGHGGDNSRELGNCPLGERKGDDTTQPLRCVGTKRHFT